MSSEENVLADLPQLIAEWQDGIISPEGMQELNDLLLCNEKARDTFLLHAHVDAGLHWNFSAQQKVADLLVTDSQGNARPKAFISQVQMGFNNDEGFHRIFRCIAGQEAHAQLWLHVYPRIRAYVFLCIHTLRDAQATVDAIVEDLAGKYRTNHSFADWAFDTARQHVHEFFRSANKNEDSGLYAQFADACLEVSASQPELDVTVFNETLGDSIPHLFSADVLRLLYLRYLHGLSPELIASHLDLPIQQVYSLLAKVRLLLWKKCSLASGDSLSDVDDEQLFNVSMFLDGKRFSEQSVINISRWLGSSDRNKSAFAKLALVHECLDRQLSVCKLLDELEACKDLSIIQAVEASIREIEQFARMSEPAAPVNAILEVKPAWRQSVVTIGLAASVLLMIVSLAWFNQTPMNERGSKASTLAVQSKDGQASEKQTRDMPPVLAPVVAVVIEALDAHPAGNFPVAVGSPIRQDETINLDRGILQLLLTSGSTLVLEAPVSLLVLDDNEIDLRYGKIVGLNGSGGDPLIVHSPTATTVDTGTEFGVAVGKNSTTSVIVYQGSVEVHEAALYQQDTLDRSVEITPGYQGSIDSDGMFQEAKLSLTHNRQFIRPDEVQLRKEALQGSFEAQAKVAFYDILRIDGLMAYQGFHAQSDAEEFSFGFRKPAIRHEEQLRFGPNLHESAPLAAVSGSLKALEDQSYFMDFDTSEYSVLGESGLLSSNGLMGLKEGDLWLSWRAKTASQDAEETQHVGLSFMRSDARDKDEVLFLGQPTDMTKFGIHIYEEDEKLRRQLDFDVQKEGVQSREVDNNTHLWIVHLRMAPEATLVDVWCDVEPMQIKDTPSHIQHRIRQFTFDRVRLELRSNVTSDSWQIDDFAAATTLEAVVALSKQLKGK